METWFLGNSSEYSRFPTTPELLTCTQFYNVSFNDPELMYKPSLFTDTCAQFHYKYLSLMLAERNIHYTKSYPRDVVEEYYIQQLLKRLQERPEHLPSLRTFIEFCTMINRH